MSTSDVIKKGIIKRKLKNSRPKRKPVLRQLSNFRNILIVSEEDKTKLVQPISKHFPRASITVLHKRKDKENNSKKGLYSAHLSDINLTGKVKNEKLARLMDEQYDLIIDLLKEDELLRYISQQIKASFIIGKKGASNSFMYDLMIDQDEDEHQFIENIAKQITLLSTNGTK